MNTADADMLVNRFWNELQVIRTGMLGLAGSGEAHAQPMTAHFAGSSGPLWFYTHSNSALAGATAEQQQRAVFHYVGPEHQLYACVHGMLICRRDQAVIDRFWSDAVARWFPQGRTDSTVTLLRFDPEEVQIWLPTSSTEASRTRLGAGEQPVDVRAKAVL